MSGQNESNYLDGVKTGLLIGLCLVAVVVLLFTLSTRIWTETDVIVKCSMHEAGQTEIISKFVTAKGFDENTVAEEVCLKQFGEKFIITDSKLIMITDK